MTSSELRVLLPVLWVAGAAAFLLPLAAFRRSGRLALLVCLLGLGGGLASLPAAWSVAPSTVGPLLAVDGLALLFQALFLLSGVVVAVLARDYLERLGVIRSEELLALLLLSLVGAMILAAARHLAAFFLGLEILTVGVYGMVAYLHDGETGLEAGIKYLVLAGASSGFLLFGMATLYLEWGTLSLTGASAAVGEPAWSPLVLAGMSLMMVGIGFKLAVVPFHLWTPDVYQGAPAPVTAFLATVSKLAVLAFLLRVVDGLPGFGATPLWSGLAGLAMASMVAGNLLALLQDDLKRILAYSSIAHLGYLLVPVLAGGADGVPAAVFYAVAYAFTTLAAFGVVAALSRGEAEEGRLEGFRGLWRTRPLHALILGTALFSLAGIPLTVGFVGKFYLLEAGVARNLWAPALVLAATSVVGLFYYLRVVVVVFVNTGQGTGGRSPGVQPDGEHRADPGIHSVGRGRAAAVVLVVLLILVLGMGVWPGPLLELVRAGTDLALAAP